MYPELGPRGGRGGSSAAPARSSKRSAVLAFGEGRRRAGRPATLHPTTLTASRPDSVPAVDVNGLSLHFERLGAGPPVLLLAGMASDSASWEPVLAPLAARFEVIVPDNRCTGRTRPSPIETSRELMLDDTVALLDALGLARVAVVGHSMGAMLGWALAARAPERVAALVPMAGLPNAPRARAELFATLARLRRDVDEAEWFRLLFQLLFAAPFFDDGDAVDEAVETALAYPHKQSPEAFARQAAGLASFLEPPDLAAIDCPVRPIVGELDALLPPAAYAAFLAAHGFGAPTVIEGAAHALHWERPGAVVEGVIAGVAETL